MKLITKESIIGIIIGGIFGRIVFVYLGGEASKKLLIAIIATIVLFILGKLAWEWGVYTATHPTAEKITNWIFRIWFFGLITYLIYICL